MPNASISVLPVSSITCTVICSWRSRTSESTRFITAARSSKEHAAQLGWAFRARSSAWATSAPVMHSSSPIGCRVTGLRSR